MEDANNLLVIGCIKGDIKIVNEALSKGAKKDYNFNTPVISSILGNAKNKTQFLKELEKLEFNIKFRSILTHAINIQNIELIKYLVEEKNILKAENTSIIDDDDVIFIDALTSNNKEIITLLVKNGIKIPESKELDELEIPQETLEQYKELLSFAKQQSQKVEDRVFRSSIKYSNENSDLRKL